MKATCGSRRRAAGSARRRRRMRRRRARRGGTRWSMRCRSPGSPRPREAGGPRRRRRPAARPRARAQVHGEQRRRDAPRLQRATTSSASTSTGGSPRRRCTAPRRDRGRATIARRHAPPRQGAQAARRVHWRGLPGAGVARRVDPKWALSSDWFGNLGGSTNRNLFAKWFLLPSLSVSLTSPAGRARAAPRGGFFPPPPRADGRRAAPL